jgi:hypothetical protein
MKLTSLSLCTTPVAASSSCAGESKDESYNLMYLSRIITDVEKAVFACKMTLALLKALMQTLRERKVLFSEAKRRGGH